MLYTSVSGLRVTLIESSDLGLEGFLRKWWKEGQEIKAGQISSVLKRCNKNSF